MFGSTALCCGANGAVGADDKKFTWVAVLSNQIDQQLIGFWIADGKADFDGRSVGAVVTDRLGSIGFQIEAAWSFGSIEDDESFRLHGKRKMASQPMEQTGSGPLGPARTPIDGHGRALVQQVVAVDQEVHARDGHSDEAAFDLAVDLLAL